MNFRDLLKEELTICQIHIDRLNLAIGRIERFYPFSEQMVSAIHEEDLPYFDLFTTRFSKFQDTLGEKVFPFLLECLGEEVINKSFIDKLNKLEQLELLPSASWWMDLRKLRNILTHEYPDNPVFLADNLNNAFIQTKRLLAFWESLFAYIEKNILKK